MVTIVVEHVSLLSFATYSGGLMEHPLVFHAFHPNRTYITNSVSDCMLLCLEFTQTNELQVFSDFKMHVLDLHYK